MALKVFKSLWWVEMDVNPKRSFTLGSSKDDDDHDEDDPASHCYQAWNLYWFTFIFFLHVSLSQSRRKARYRTALQCKYFWSFFKSVCSQRRCHAAFVRQCKCFCNISALLIFTESHFACFKAWEDKACQLLCIRGFGTLPNSCLV